MSSLKAYIPRLAQIFGMTPAALYERQRALVRAGLLTPEPGRGLGSGVRLTAEAVALMLISVLSADSLSETAAKTREFAAATTRQPPNETFKDAIVEILSNVSAAEAACKVEVSISRNRKLCKIIFTDDKERNEIIYLARGSLAGSFTHVLVAASFYDVRAIAKDLRKAKETGQVPLPDEGDDDQ